MKLVTLDWVIIGAYFVLSGRSTEEFFLSNRSMPWWLAGTSMVATTFATHTPLAVTEMVARNGVAGNWLWWAMLLRHAHRFLFAGLSPRAWLMIDVEFVELRHLRRTRES